MLADRLTRRPVLAAVVMAIAVGLPAALAAYGSAATAGSRSRAEAIAETATAAAEIAGAAATRLAALQAQILAASESQLLQVGAARNDHALVATVLAEFHPLIRDARSLHFVDAGGAQVASDPPDQRLPAGTGTGPPGPILTDGAGTATITAPVRDGFGRGIGTIVAAIAPGTLLDQPARGQAYLVDAAGRALGPDAAPRDLATDPTVSRLRAGERLAGELADPFSGQTRIVASAPIADTGWHAVATRGDDIAAGTAAGIPVDLALFPVALVVAVAVGTYGIARSVNAFLRERRALEATNAKLAVAGRHKTEFLANVNHELRTPLNSILGFAALLAERTGLDERQARYVRNIREAGGQLLGLVDDILDLAAIEAGRLAVRRERVALRDLLRGPLDLARETAEARDQRLAVGVLPEVDVVVDAPRLRRAFGLILASASDATPAGGTVGVSAALDGTDLVLGVSDAGPAVAPERAARASDVYARLREGPATTSGPGFALAKRLVELHGGVLAVDGGDGGGSVVSVRLPGVLAPAAVG